ncbi:hypothetical protein [Marinifilum caeruleilacunae]|uniref:Uncharacterized protein n=1 Tax=Marinifilum caeruleilacunae TaxID=2499076 RepID=A0ABX1WSL2_9BACT|nr:hypothetical protein [Marinifilum caeruleilacunae]NOU59097.1 hypothetical protein [Marinifilum caeruleilacunae]
MRKNQTTAVLIETAKTVGGVMAGRMVVVAGKKALKVNEETDPKKRKIKEVAIGAGIAGVGIVGALKLPNNYKSIAAGFATAGALSAMTPFAKGEDKGFIPALHGTTAMAALEGGDLYDEEAIELEENEFEVNALAALRDPEIKDDFVEYEDDEVQEVVSTEVN